MMGSFLAVVAVFVAAVSVVSAKGTSLFANIGFSAVFLCAAGKVSKKQPVGKVLLSLAGVAGVGTLLGLYASTPSLGPGHVAHFASDTYSYIEGRVLSTKPAGGKLKIEVECIYVGRGEERRKTHGRLLLTIGHSSNEVMPGDVIGFRAKLRRPSNFGNPGGFDYEGFLARRRIYVTAFVWDGDQVEMLSRTDTGAHRLLASWRKGVHRLIDSVAEGSDAAVLAALVVGERWQISDELRDTLARAGVAHVLAISGLHIGIVSGAGYFMARLILSRSSWLLLACNLPALAAFLSLVPAVLYAALAGGSISTLRALVMVAALALATAIGRPRSLLRSLGLAALILVAARPLWVQEVSFQLSFASVLGIIAAVRRRRSPAGGAISARSSGRETGAAAMTARFALDCIGVSAAATIATAPIVAFYFQRVSLVAPVANLVILPFLGLGTVVPAVAGAFLQPINQSTAGLLFLIAAWSVHAGLFLARFFAHLPFASWVSFIPTGVELFLYYSLLALAITRLKSKVMLLGFALLFSAAALDASVWLWRRYGDSRLHVTFLSVGQGDAAVVEFPGGRVMVVDGGPHYRSGFDAGSRLVGPFLRSRKIMRLDYLVMTHAQVDHCGGLAALVREFRPGELWWNGRYSRVCLPGILEAAVGSPLRLRKVERGMTASIGGVIVRVCHPQSGLQGVGVNDLSVVLHLRHGGVSLALAADIEKAAEAAMVSSGCLNDSTLLKAPHHGSLTSSSPAFIDAVAPRAAVFSTGRNNRFGFPREEVVSRYLARGVRLFQTDEDGAIELVSGGDTYSLCYGRGMRVCERFRSRQ